MSATLEQIYALNPTTVVNDTDLFYLVQSPYTPGTDAGITGADLKTAMGTGSVNPGLINQLGYYAASGSTISGLTTANNGVLITSAGGVPSISSTLPNAVQDNITRLGTITSGIWHGTIIAGTYGGTGVNNGASTITIGGSVTFSGAFTFAGTLTGNTAVTFPTSGTLAITSQLLVSPLTTKGDIWVWSTTNDRLPVATGDGKILQVSSGAATGLAYSTATYPSVATSTGSFIYANGTNFVASTSLWPNTVGSAGKILISDGTNNIYSTPLWPTTAGTLGSIVISDGTNKINSTSLWPNTVGSAGKIIRSDGTTNAYTTSTFADTYAVSTILYASSANTITGLATANSGVLVTSSGGVPSISSTLPAFTTSSITFNPTTSGIVGTTTNDSASAGFVGQEITSVVLVGSAVALTTNTQKTITSVSLTAGDWDVTGVLWLDAAGTTTTSRVAVSISQTNDTVVTTPAAGGSFSQIYPSTSTAGANNVLAAPRCRISLASTTTVYLVALATFLVSTLSGYGNIIARRVR